MSPLLLPLRRRILSIFSDFVTYRMSFADTAIPCKSVAVSTILPRSEMLTWVVKKDLGDDVNCNRRSCLGNMYTSHIHDHRSLVIIGFLGSLYDTKSASGRYKGGQGTVGENVLLAA